MAEPRKVGNAAPVPAAAQKRGGALKVPPRVLEWATRIAFLVVFAWNVLCAVQFICWPVDYVAAYQLEGAGAAAAIQGMGVAFLMWNATYPLFIWRPGRHRALGGIIIAQQAIGLAGELFIASGLGAGQELVARGIARFVGFDAIGLVLMCAALYLLIRFTKAPKASDPAEDAEPAEPPSA